MALLAAKMLRLTILSSPSFVSICLGGIVMLLCVCVCVRACVCVRVCVRACMVMLLLLILKHFTSYWTQFRCWSRNAAIKSAI